MKLVIVKGGSVPATAPDAVLISFDGIRLWIRSGEFFRKIGRFSSATLHVQSFEVLSRPLLSLLLLRMLSRGGAFVQNEAGRTERVSLVRLAKATGRYLTDLRGKRSLIRAASSAVQDLQAHDSKAFTIRRSWDDCRPFYLRTDLSFGVKSGGSIGHIAGVLNNLDHFFARPLLLTTDAIATVRPDIRVERLHPTRRYWDFPELPSLDSNWSFFEQAVAIAGTCRPTFIYQRYSVNSWLGVQLSRHYQAPLVLEYNGSEIWIARHWGRRLKFERLSEDIEMLNLRCAQLVVVVSDPMREELIDRGIDGHKILVNPNGVDADRYSPMIDPEPVRRRYALAGKTVIGFIGTFGPWHGAEVLAEAFGRLASNCPALRDQLRLLLIGDGPRMAQVKEAVARHDIGDLVVFTGTIPQADGPSFLAACDVLASPHVPNPDGTPFFGSPTKLFEYMAMGKGIVASKLNQIGDILEHRRNAWLVEPADPLALMHGLAVLVGDPTLRQSLGRDARQLALSRYTWREHTRRIVEKLDERPSQ